MVAAHSTPCVLAFQAILDLKPASYLLIFAIAMVSPVTWGHFFYAVYVLPVSVLLVHLYMSGTD